MQFDIDAALNLVEQAIRPYPPAALYGLADEGLGSVFQQLVACVLSIRTLDETTVRAARSLFGAGREPAEIAALSPSAIEQRIGGCAFAKAKARTIHGLAQAATQYRDHKLPCEREALIALPGIGPKCANLVLAVACNEPCVAVDTHVHRVTNRWGYVKTRTPDQTLSALEEKLPRRYWRNFNALVMPFGKHICTAALPGCSTCLLRDMCPKLGVARHR